MILADKIIDLRKKAGWSQEELAEKLAVTRQSVSKWEGAQSIPDMDKVVQMSRLFGVTTDYLLKDEIEIAEPTVTEDDRRPPLRRVTIGEASDYLALRRTAAPKMALATMLCIFSPIALIGLAAVSELSASAFPLREEAAAGIGLCVLLILVATAVVLFMDCGNKAKETSVYKGYKQDKIEMRGDRVEMSDFPLYLNTVAGGLDRRDQTIGGFSFVVKIYAVPVVEIIG